MHTRTVSQAEDMTKVGWTAWLSAITSPVSNHTSGNGKDLISRLDASEPRSPFRAVDQLAHGHADI
jgi:hypothetical protein